MDNYILISDNKTIKSIDLNNQKLVHKKYKVTISKISLEIELKKFFKWKKDCTYKRLVSLGSSEYDNFIIYLFNLKY